MPQGHRAHRGQRRGRRTRCRDRAARSRRSPTTSARTSSTRAACRSPGGRPASRSALRIGRALGECLAQHAPLGLPDGRAGDGRREQDLVGHLVRGQHLGAGPQQRGRVERRSSGTTNATGTSPSRGCGRATTAASRTPDRPRSTCSTSTGSTFSPPRTIRSFTRPVTVRWPCSPRRPRSPVRYQPSAQHCRLGLVVVAEHQVGPAHPDLRPRWPSRPVRGRPAAPPYRARADRCCHAPAAR